MPKGTDQKKLAPHFKYSGSSISVANVEQISGVTVNDFKSSSNSPAVYTVKAKDGSSADYQVRIINDR